jgi:predicted dehydrogenase
MPRPVRRARREGRTGGTHVGLRIGVIGTGRLGRIHVRIFKRVPEVELVGCYDVVEERSQQAAAEFGARAFDRMDSLLGAVDAVSIVVPTVYHEKVALEALSAGKHVFLEKPMAASVEQAERIQETAAARALVLQIGHVERFNEAIARCLPYIESPSFIEIHRLSPFSVRGIDVSVIMDLMIHDLDLLIYFLNKLPVDIRAKGAGVLTQAPDIVNARLEYDDGCVANITASRVSIEPMRKVRIFSKDRYLSIDLSEGRIKHVQKGEAFGRGVAMLKEKRGKLEGVTLQDFLNVEETRIEGEEPLFNELRSFCMSVLNGTAPAVTGDDGLKALRLAVAIQKIVEGTGKR